MTSAGEAQSEELENSSTVLIEIYVVWVVWQEMSLFVVLVVLEGFRIYRSLLLPQLVVCVVFSGALCC